MGSYHLTALVFLPSPRGEREGRVPSTRIITPRRMFNLDHLRSQVCEQHGRVRTREDASEVDDSDVGQGRGHSVCWSGGSGEGAPGEAEEGGEAEHAGCVREEGER